MVVNILGAADSAAFELLDVRLDEIVEVLLIFVHRRSFGLEDLADRLVSLRLFAERRQLFVLHYMR